MRTDIIARFVEKEVMETRIYAMFTAHTDIGDLEVMLKDHCIPHAGYRYVVEVRKGATSEFRLFITRYFANRCFEQLRIKYDR